VAFEKIQVGAYSTENLWPTVCFNKVHQLQELPETKQRTRKNTLEHRTGHQGRGEDWIEEKFPNRFCRLPEVF
jgi:hypothetical protein